MHGVHISFIGLSPLPMRASLLVFFAAAWIGTADPAANYTCLNQTDIAGASCDLRNVGGGKSVSELAALCDAAYDEGCRGFNNNGYLKRCVRASCGAIVKPLQAHPQLIACFRSDTPVLQPRPPSCSPSPGPAPGPGPGPEPGPPTPLTPYGGRCATTAYKPECNCSGRHPPFGPPARPLPMQADHFFPFDEARQRREEMRLPELVSLDVDARTATVRDNTTNRTVTMSVAGAGAWGWSLLWVSPGVPRATRVATGVPEEEVEEEEPPFAVLLRSFKEWGEMVYVFEASSAGGDRKPAVAVRRPVGDLDGIAQPLYDFPTVDEDYMCKQDVDPTDWLTHLATNMSDGEEANTTAVASVMAPNPDSGLFGNPEERNKFVLTNGGDLLAMPWGGDRSSFVGGDSAPWQLQLQPGCGGVPLGRISDFAQSKLGMLGRYMRAVHMGIWRDGADDDSSGGCGADLMAVSPPPGPSGVGVNSSVALLRLSVVQEDGSNGTNANTSYVRVVMSANGTTLLRLDELGSNGEPFFRALLQQARRWTPFVESGSRLLLPSMDQRYVDTAAALLTMYLNLDQGHVPEYGAGKFWNTYNTNLPLDTLALNGALLEWGHVDTALPYLSYFFEQNVNATTGLIEYKNFGCDSDADYGRILDLYARAARYSYATNATWARQWLPVAHAMAGSLLARRVAALNDFQAGHPLHGIIAGSPEHDICGDPGYFFSINAWAVRGFLSLNQLHSDFPSLTPYGNATLEAALLTTAEAWRADIAFAANFTAVRAADFAQTGEYFFLHPVVGSIYSKRTPKSPPLLEGGDEATCVARGTCFASMSAGLPGGGSNQHTNYANFRIFSETLLAGILEPRYEQAIMHYRDAHRGTLMGMTRFRDGLDDMPILGYGRGALAHDRLGAFHSTLAGHSLNYLSRGTYWGTEQRQQLDYTKGNGTGIIDNRWRNDCGVGGEDCSLCMVSSIAPAYWVRWMLLWEHPDEALVFVARTAPRRWYSRDPQPFGIDDAPTRFGRVSFRITPSPSIINGTVRLDSSAWVGSVAEASALPLVAVRVRSADAARPWARVSVEAGDAKIIAWHSSNETAIFQLGQQSQGQVSGLGVYSFNFTASE